MKMSDWATAEPTASVDATKRLHWIEVAKGIGIALVVLGHGVGGLIDAGMTAEYPIFRRAFAAIYIFHMPLFFLLAGLFVQDRLARDPRKFGRSLATKIAWPYFLWSVIQFTIIYAASDVVTKPIHGYWSSVLALPWNPVSQFWFLHSLLLLHLTSLVLAPRIGAGSVFLLLIMAQSFARTVALPEALADTAAMAPYYGVGLLMGVAGLRHTIVDRPPLARTLLFPALAAALIGCAAYAMIRDTGDLLFDRFLTKEICSLAWGIGSTAAALAGSAALIGVASLARIEGSAALRYLGRRSLPIFILNILFVAGARIVLVKGFGIGEPLLILPVVVIAGLAGPIAAIEILRRLKLDRPLGLS